MADRSACRSRNSRMKQLLGCRRAKRRSRWASRPLGTTSLSRSGKRHSGKWSWWWKVVGSSWAGYTPERWTWIKLAISYLIHWHFNRWVSCTVICCRKVSLHTNQPHKVEIYDVISRYSMWIYQWGICVISNKAPCPWVHNETWLVGGELSVSVILARMAGKWSYEQYNTAHGTRTFIWALIELMTLEGFTQYELRSYVLLIKCTVRTDNYIRSVQIWLNLSELVAQSSTVDGWILSSWFFLVLLVLLGASLLSWIRVQLLHERHGDRSTYGESTSSLHALYLQYIKYMYGVQSQGKVRLGSRVSNANDRARAWAHINLRDFVISIIS